MDHVLFATAPHLMYMDPDDNEVLEARYVDRQGLQDLLNDPDELVAPWFRVLTEKFLIPVWWDALEEHGGVKEETTLEIDRL